MAAILQLRRGTTTPLSLAESELFYNTTDDVLIVGDGGTTKYTLIKIGSNTGNVTLTGNMNIIGGISGSTLNITGNAKIDGDLRLGGNIFLGSGSDGDLINVNATLSGSLIPETDAVFDLGSDSYKYRNLYVLSASIEELNGVSLDSFISYTNLFTQSADSRLNNLELDSQSQDSRLDNIELFTSSQESNNNDIIELFATASNHETRIDTLELSSDSNTSDIIELFATASEHETRIDVLSSFTGSYATTGSNTFVGNQIVSASIDVSGSTTSEIFRLIDTETSSVPVLNSTFNLDLSGSVDSFIEKALVLGDGKILVAGRFTSVDGHTTNDMARLNSDGTIDTSFSSPVFGTTIEGDTGGYLNTFVTQSDGKIIVGGNFSRVNGALRAGLARLDSDGILDTSFAAQSWGSFGEVRDVVIQNDNKIVCVGSFTSGSRRINTDGTLDTTFDISQGNSQPLAFNNGNFYSVALLDSGSEQAVLIGGNFQQWGSYSYPFLVKLNPNGTLDFGFAGSNLDIITGNSLDRINQIKVGDDGYIYVAGRFRDTGIGNHAGFARLYSEDIGLGAGTLDNGFRTYISGSHVNDFNFYDGDKILLGGSFTTFGNATITSANRFAIIDQNDGALVSNWITDGLASKYNFNASVNSTTILPSDNVLVGGTFTQANSTAREGLASLKLTGFGDITLTSEYTLTANTDRLLISSSNTHFSGDVNISGSVYASSFSGSFTGSFSGTIPSQDGRLDNLELTSESHDSRLDNIESFTSSQEDLNLTFATTGSNVFVGDEVITGSLGVSGSLHIKSPSYSESGSLILVNETETHIYLRPSGSVEVGAFQLYDSGDSRSILNLNATEISVGWDSTDILNLGNTESENYIRGNTQFLQNITSSANIEAVYFYGDGSNLTNVTASHVEYSDVVNKPTLVSGSSQIDVNNTQNFQDFSSSVDSRLDLIEGDLSSSVNSQLENIHQYTSSLKQAVDVDGQNLTIYGNLTVQGETTTLNTTELLIEDKVLSLASGSTTSAAADGAGLHISGADVSILWNDSQNTLDINKLVSSSVGFKGDGSQLTNIQHENIDFGDSLIVSGSSQLTQSLDFRYLEINGDNVVSGSSQITITNTTGFSTFSGSLKTTDDGQDSRLDNLEAFTSSQESKDSTLSTLTSSYDGRLSNLELFTSSQESKDSTLETYTSSIDTKFNTLETYTASIDSDLSNLHSYTQSNDTLNNTQNGRLDNLELFSSSQESKDLTLETYTASIDSDLNVLHLYTQSNDANISNLYNSASQYQSFSESIDSTIKNKIDLEGVVSSSSDTSTISLSIDSGVISGVVIGEVVSGSDQVTQSLDLRYEQSGSVAQLVGENGYLGALGSAAWYNVSSSISNGDPAVLGNAGAVKDYIDEQLLIIGAGDITAVIAGDGISGGADSGPATLTLDTASAHFNDGVNESITPFSSSVSASIAELAANSGYINYVTNSIEQLTGIEVADFDNNVAVTFIGGTLKFIFGTPAVPSSISTSLSGFLVDRFNNVNDGYDVNASWNNGGYTLISASLYEGSTLLTEVGVGTSLSFNTTTSGSHTYRLEYTGSSPLDGTIYTTSTTTTGTISKSNPASPTLTPSPSIQLGVASNQIEQGATGSIPFTSSSADPSNGWNLVDVTTNVPTPYDVIGSATGSSSIVITATANYESPIGENNPDLSTSTSTTRTYTKIRSLRYGASDVVSFTQSELENISEWDTSLGGSIGTIVKGTTNPSGQSVTISWSGDKYHYIVFDSARSNLSNITTNGFGIFGSFTLTTVGQYKVYKTNTLQAGGAGSSITYTLT